MTQEGEEENGENGDIFERQHELAVRPEHRVVQWLFDAVGTAQNRGKPARDEDRCCSHKS